MPAYILTLHTYRSWSEDDRRGHFHRGRQGLKKPDTGLAIHRSRHALYAPRRLTAQQRKFIVDSLPEMMARRDVRLHAASCTATHVHLVASWFGEEVFFADIPDPMGQAKHLAARTKNILATRLSKKEQTTGNRWFSRGSGCTPIEDREHLNHLLEIYLPKHRLEGGIVQIFDNGKTST